MCTIQKLGILGIRSFSPHQLETIKFEKPLTLIVGHNGAGKTTIVECLKMATTGEVPPSANKGQNFLHDPRLVGTSDVKGQIRLIFSNPMQTQVAVVRNFQLSNTKDRKGQIKSSFKALEAVVQLKDAGGNAKATSSKCVDTNATIANLMGVPKAVLENVIFCHQEDSGWPLSDMSTIKKRFDDLFGSARFTKALDIINGLRKQYAKVAKEKQHELQLLAKDITQWRGIQEKLDSCTRKKAKFEDDIKVISVAVEEWSAKYSEAQKTLSSIAGVGREWTLLDERIKEEERKAEDLTSKLPEIYNESYEDLVSIQESLQEEARLDESELEEAKRKVGEAETALEQAVRSRDRSQLQSLELVRAEEKVSNGQKRLEMLCGEADRIIEEGDLALKRFCRPISTARSEAERSELVQKFQKGLREYEALQMAKQDEVVGELSQKLKQIDADIQLLEASFQQSDLERARLSAQLEESFKLEKELRKLQKELEVSEAKIARQATYAAELKAQESQLEELRIGRQNLEEEQNSVQQSLTGLERVKAKIEEMTLQESRRNDLMRKKESLEASARNSKDPNVQLLLQKLDSSLLQWKLSSQIDQQKLEVSNLTQQVQRSTLIKGRVQHQYQSCTERMSQVKDQLSSLSAKIKKKVGTDSEASYNQSLESAKADVDLALKELMIAKNAQEMYGNYFDYSVQRKKCAFCTRCFKDSKEVEGFKRHMEQRLKKLPSQIEISEAALEDRKRELGELEALADDVGTLTRLNLEVANLQRELDTSRKECDQTEEALTRYETNLNRARATLEALEFLTKIATEVESLSTEIDLLEMDLASMKEAIDEELNGPTPSKKKRSRASTGRTVRMEDYQALKEKEQTLRGQLQRKSEEQRKVTMVYDDLRMQCQSILVEERLVVERKDRIRQLEEEIESIGSRQIQLSKCQEKLQKEEKEISSSKSSRADLQNQLRKVNEEHLIASRKSARQISFASNLAADLVKLETEMRSAQFEIGQLAALKSDLDQQNTNVDRKTLQTREAKHSLEVVQEKIKERTEMEQILAKNLELHHLKRLVQKLHDKQDDIKRKAGGANMVKLKEAFEKAEVELKRAERGRAEKQGEVNANEEWIKQLRDEERHPRFSGLETKHSDLEIDSILCNTTVNDLKRYHSALDRALMIYHNEKMKEINATIRQLWQRIYRGNDIDSIAIRSSTEEDSVVASTSRSYNYRVVMIKNNVELEMKGRCSAGQRVLTCLIIRLALAESFAVQCGILTLDEPTTNLDRKNVESLARALADLIETRRVNENFQLILITHDEEFVNYLQRYDASDHFYQVRKDENGHSIIRDIQF